MLTRPSECSEACDSAFLRSSSPVKLSRPQKRRRRLQLLAIHRASIDGQKTNIAEGTNDSCTATNGHGRSASPNTDVQLQLHSLEGKVDQILNLIFCSWSMPYSPFMPDCGVGFGVLEPDSVLDYLNPNAAEFVPEVEASRNDAGENAKCPKCHEAGDDCVCEEIFCIGCLRLASGCVCKNTELQHLECPVCEWSESLPSLYSSNWFSLPASRPEICPECTTSTQATARNYLEPSAHPCGKCQRVDCQESVQSCAGVDCLCEALFHESCLTWTVTGACRGYLCAECVAAGNLPHCSEDDACNTDIDSKDADMNDDYAGLEDTTNKQDGHRAADSVPTLGSSGGLLEYWDGPECIRFYKCIAAKVRCDPELTAQQSAKAIEEAVTLAKHRIPPDVLQVMLDEIEHMKASVQ